MLTPKQRIVLEHIIAFSDRYGVAPTYHEIMQGCSIKSASEVSRCIECLVKRKYIRKTILARSIEVLREPKVHGDELRVLKHLRAHPEKMMNLLWEIAYEKT